MSAQTNDPRYDTLPAAVKATIDRNSFGWLSDREKDEFLQRACEPDADSEDPCPR